MSRDNRIEGIGSITGGEYNTVSIQGVGKIKEDVKCEEVKIEGLCKVKGSLETEKFSCEGMGNAFKDIKAKQVRIEGMLRIKGAKLEAEKIMCQGMLSCTDEVSADDVEIEGLCSIRKLYGDTIKIKQATHATGKFVIPGMVRTFGSIYVGRKVSKDYSIIDTLECSELYAEHLESKFVSAHKVVLGPQCKIDCIECDGELIYDETCQIGKIEAGHVTKRSTTRPINIENKGEEDMADIKLTKILDLYKEGTINADEAEKMLKGLGTINQSTMLGTSSNWGDNKLRVVVMRGNQCISQNEYRKGMSIEVAYQGDIADVECWGNLTCGNIEGDVNVGGNLHAANIEGSVKSGGNINCKNIQGDVKCGGNVNCMEVDGNISAGGSIKLSK